MNLHAADRTGHPNPSFPRCIEDGDAHAGLLKIHALRQLFVGSASANEKLHELPLLFAWSVHGSSGSMPRKAHLACAARAGIHPER
jgi:hypothetical protein